MGLFPASSPQRYVKPEGAVYGTVVTANASANGKGAVTQLVASTPFDASGIWVWIATPNTAGASYLVDFTVTPISSPQAIIPNLLFSLGTFSRQGLVVSFPIWIPSGTNLGAQCQCTTGSATIEVATTLVATTFNPAWPVYSRVIDYGTATGDSGGTQVDPGEDADTKGSYAQLVASTTADIKKLVVIVSNQGNQVPASATFEMDIAIGSGGSEQVIIDNIFFETTALTDTIFPKAFEFPISIPSGSRLAARARSSTTDAEDRVFDVAVYGVS